MKRLALSIACAVAFAACATACCTQPASGKTDGGTSSSGGTGNGSSSSSGSTSSGGTTSGGGSSSGSTTSSGSTSGGGSSTGGVSGGTIKTLLVDNDTQSAFSNPDTSLTFFEGWLTAAGIGFDVYQEPADGSDVTDLNPADPQLTGIDTIVFFTGSYAGDGAPTVSPAQQTALQAWLNEGGKTLLLFSPGTPASIGQSWVAETNTFLTQDCGFQMDSMDPAWWNALAAQEVPISKTASTLVTGSSTVPAFSGKQWTAVNNKQVAKRYFYNAVVQPEGSNVDVLATIQADPASSGANSAFPVAIGHNNVGTAGTSKVVYVGLPVEDISNLFPGQNVPCDFLNAIQSYAGMGGTASNCGLTVPTGSATSPTLLVDNDTQSAFGGTDTSLPIFQGWLTAAGGAFATYQEPAGPPPPPYDLTNVDPTDPGLAGLDTIVWFTGLNRGDGVPTVSWPQQALLGAWLDEGGKLLVLFSPGLAEDLGGSWRSNIPTWFVNQYLGLLTFWEDPTVWVPGSPGSDTGADQLTSEVVKGSTGIAAFAGKQWTIVNSNANSAFTTIVQPVGSNVDVLATVPADPTGAGANTDTPVVVGYKKVGAKGTSTVVYVGILLENVSSTIPGFNSQGDFLSAIQSYAAVP